MTRDGSLLAVLQFCPTGGFEEQITIGVDWIGFKAVRELGTRNERAILRIPAAAIDLREVAGRVKRDLVSYCNRVPRLSALHAGTASGINECPRVRAIALNGVNVCSAGVADPTADDIAADLASRCWVWTRRCGWQWL